jgi:hypothetical protein
MINIVIQKDKTPHSLQSNGACFTTHQNLLVQQILYPLRQFMLS